MNRVEVVLSIHIEAGEARDGNPLLAEKVFDELKNKLDETKAWAKTPMAKTNQAQLLCLTHNMMTLFENRLEQTEGIRNEAELQRKAQFRLDFIYAENSMGFHAPQETARILAGAIDYARQGQLIAETLPSAMVQTSAWEQAEAL